MSGGSFDYLAHREAELLAGNDGGSLGDMIYWCEQIPELVDVANDLKYFEERTERWQKRLRDLQAEYHEIFGQYKGLLHDVEWCASSDISLDDLVKNHAKMKEAKE